MLGVMLGAKGGTEVRTTLRLRVVGWLGSGDGTEDQPLPRRARRRRLQIPVPGLQDVHGQRAGRIHHRSPAPCPGQQLECPRTRANGSPRRWRPRRDGSHRAFAHAGLLPVDLLTLRLSRGAQPPPGAIRFQPRKGIDSWSPPGLRLSSLNFQLRF
jgi:hypothetical protein